MFFIGFIAGSILVSLGFLFINRRKSKKSKNYTRRGIYQKEYESVSSTTGRSTTISVIYELGELESTEDLSKVEVINLRCNNSDYNSENYKKKLSEMINHSWISSSDVKWIVATISDIRNSKIEKILK